MIEDWKQLIEAFGGHERFAECLRDISGEDITGNAMRVAKQRNRVRADLWPHIVKAANTPAIVRKYPDIAGLSYETLVKLQQGASDSAKTKCDCA